MKFSHKFGTRLASRAAVVVFAAAMSVLLSGCSTFEGLNPFGGGEKYEKKYEPDTAAETMYNQGLEKLEKKDFEGSAKKFADLERAYPYSQWAKKGLLMTTFAHYKNGDYSETIAAADRYVGLYPGSPDAAYATYMAGMSYYNQIPDVTRDQERAEKAMRHFNEVIEKYPNSEYVDDSRYKLQITRDQLAGKEMSVGRFYLERKNYLAAVNRFREVLFKYQNTRHAEEALERLTEAYLALGIVNEAQTAAAVLGHNFPDSPWYKDAYAKLKGGGLEPQEHQDSWISKTFRKVGLVEFHSKGGRRCWSSWRSVTLS